MPCDSSPRGAESPLACGVTFTCPRFFLSSLRIYLPRPPRLRRRFTRLVLCSLPRSRPPPLLFISLFAFTFGLVMQFSKVSPLSELTKLLINETRSWVSRRVGARQSHGFGGGSSRASAGRRNADLSGIRQIEGAQFTITFSRSRAAKSSKSHKTPASSSSSTTPSMTSSSLPAVSTQAPITSSHHSTPVSNTPNSQTNVVR